MVKGVHKQVYTIRMLAICLCVILSACTHPRVVQKPLEQWVAGKSEIVFKQVAGNRSSDVLVLMAFSGGGTRAASFSYGVLQEIAATMVMTADGRRRLLDEVDLISSVSGGSFPNAYFALYGEAIFQNFETAFLRKDIQGRVQDDIFSPASWSALSSSTYSRSDIAAAYYHENVFHGATFADLNRPGAPVVVINATDLATGIRVSFTRPFFDIICADLDAFPVARALAATSAVPILLTPIALKNYAGSCGYKTTPWITALLQAEQGTIGKAQAQGLAAFQDAGKHPWLHLVDGGIADNLGLRSLVALFGASSGAERDPRMVLAKRGHERVRHILIMLVNSNNRPHLEWALKQDTPSVLDVAAAVSTDQINRYSHDSIEITRLFFRKLAKQLSTEDKEVTFDFVRVDFKGVAEDAEREKLNNIGTSFRLSDAEVDLLISNARKVLRASPEFKTFLERVNGKTVGP